MIHSPLGARGHTSPAYYDGRTRSFLNIKQMFQSTDACREKRPSQARWRGASVPRRAGARWAGLVPDPTLEARGGAQVGPRRPRRRVPARPSALRGILYNSPSRSKRKRGARCRGRRAEVLKPRARGASHAAPTRRGKRPERLPHASPREGTRLWSVPFRKPRASPTASASSNTVPCLSPAPEPPPRGQGRGPRWQARLGGG